MVESVLVMLSPAFCDFGWCVAQAALTVTKLARKDWNIKFKKTPQNAANNAISR